MLECRRRVQLEDLRDDLSVYLKILRSAMIELINKDYADFVNLSSNLVSCFQSHKWLLHMYLVLGICQNFIVDHRFVNPTDHQLIIDL